MINIERPLIQSYVWHGGKAYYISTINRRCSAILGPGVYAETIVWDYDPEVHRIGLIIWQGEGPDGSVDVHLMACKALSQHGSEALGEHGGDQCQKS